MQRDKEYLIDILEAAKLTLTYVNEKTMKEIINDTRCQDAVIHRLEIIGEAARQSCCVHTSICGKCRYGDLNCISKNDPDMLEAGFFF
ncbi:MAG: DUF86 domain-containing protein [Methanosarcinales archaeon]